MKPLHQILGFIGLAVLDWFILASGLQAMPLLMAPVGMLFLIPCLFSGRTVITPTEVTWLRVLAVFPAIYFAYKWYAYVFEGIKLSTGWGVPTLY